MTKIHLQRCLPIALRLAIKQLWRRKSSSLLTIFSVIIAVAATVAVSMTVQTTEHAFRGLFRSLAGKATWEIAAVGGGGLDESVSELVAAVAGVQTAAPLIQRPTILYFGDHRIKLVTLGIDPVRDAQLHDFVITRGKSLLASKGVLIEETLADRLRVEPGDAVRLLTRRGRLRARVVGLFRSDGTLASGGGIGLLMSIPAAQYAAKMPGRIHSVQVVVTAGADEESVASKIADVLPPNVEFRRPAARSSFADETSLSVRHGMETSRAFLLFVATLIIANTYFISVTQRRRTLGLVRAIGATRGQVMATLGCEAVIVGVVGATLGWGTGVIAAHRLSDLMGNLYQTELPAPQMTVSSFALALLFGAAVSVIGVWVPARVACRMQPVDAMRGNVRMDTSVSSMQPAKLGLALAVGFGGLLAASIQGYLPTPVSAWAGVMILMGLVLLFQPVTASVSRGLSACFGKLLPVETKLAKLQLLRHPSRTALTIGILFVAVSTGVGMASSLTSHVEDVRTWYRRTIVADFFVRAMSPDMATGQAADLPDEVGPQIAKIPNVTSIETLRLVRATAGDRSVIVIAHDYGPNNAMMFDLTEGSSHGLPGRLAEGEIVIGSVLARRAGDLHPGDTIALETTSGTRELPIAAIANDYLAGGQTIYMRRSVAETMFGFSGVDAYLVRCQPQDRQRVESSLSEITDQHGLLLQSFSELQRQIDQMMTGVVAGLWSLVVIGFAVATLGTTNTLTVNVVEQTRELGLLRIIGTTKTQIRRIVLLQATMIGVLALFPGVIVGGVIAYLVYLTTYPISGHAVELSLSPLLFLVTLISGLFIVVLSAWLPASRAASLSLIDAIQEH